LNYIYDGVGVSLYDSQISILITVFTVTRKLK